MAFLLIFLGAYLLGSIPSGYLIGRVRGTDIRRHGSGNIGATNALRVLGKKWGYLCFAMDISKGAAAVWLARLVAAPHFALDPAWAGLTGAIGALVGHAFPAWLGFRGGKGIATSGGIAIALFPWPVFVISISVWAVVFFAYRIVSAASIAAALSLAATTVMCAALHQTSPVLAGVACAISAFAIWLHRPNIARLLKGEEPRFEKRKK